MVWRILDHLLQGGWVMLPLAAVSVAMWALIVDRFLLYRELGRRDLDLAEAGAALRRGEAPDGRGLRARLVAGYLAWRGTGGGGGPSLLRASADELRREYEGGVTLIEVLAAMSPLLGLLGTVLGMIETFDVISVFGTGNPRAMASGISVALITTQTGLLVAIPGLFAAGRLRRMATHRNLQLEETVVALGRELQTTSGTTA
jgi:biopolymer transport protein ExbB